MKGEAQVPAPTVPHHTHYASPEIKLPKPHVQRVPVEQVPVGAEILDRFEDFQGAREHSHVFGGVNPLPQEVFLEFKALDLQISRQTVVNRRITTTKRKITDDIG